MYVWWLLLFTWRVREGKKKRRLHVNTDGQTREHTPVCGASPPFPKCTRDISVCKKQNVHRGRLRAWIHSVLLCDVFNMTRIKRLWGVLSFFEQSCWLIVIIFHRVEIVHVSKKNHLKPYCLFLVHPINNILSMTLSSNLLKWQKLFKLSQHR